MNARELIREVGLAIVATGYRRRNETIQAYALRIQKQIQREQREQQLGLFEEATP